LYGPLEFVWDYPGEPVPQPIWILLKQVTLSGMQWHQLGHIQICTSPQTNDHARQHHTNQFLQAGYPSCRPTNSVKALKTNV